MNEFKKSSATIVIFILLLAIGLVGFTGKELNFGKLTGAAVAQQETADKCSNSIDDDLDGYVDCADQDCNGVGSCPLQTLPTDIVRGCSADSDCKPDYICRNSRCYFYCNSRDICIQHYNKTNFCMTATGLLNTCSGKTCTADSNCPKGEYCPAGHCVKMVVENCTNGRDDDWDGWTDCQDQDCNGKQGPSFKCEYPEKSCNDGIDNNGDGYADCKDMSCYKLELCGNGISNAKILNPKNGAVYYKDVPITFSGEASFGSGTNGGQIQVQWDFGDNTTSTSKMTQHSYDVSENSEFIVRFTANYFGLGASDSIKIYIKSDLPPVASIDSPKDGSTIAINKKIFFSGKNSFNPNGNITKYVWDFGEKDKPWGKLTMSEEYGWACKSLSSTATCNYLEANIAGEVNPDILGNPCSCQNIQNSSNIYPNTVFESSTAILYKDYKSKYVCTPYGEEKTNKCTVSLTVYDNTNQSSTTSISVYLSEANETMTGDSCPSLVNNSHSCLFNETDVIYNSTLSSCCCDTKFNIESNKCIAETVVTHTTPTCPDYTTQTDCLAQGCYWYNIQCNTEPEENGTSTSSGTETECGDSICNGDENVFSCIADCHCPDGTCQKTLEDKNTCPQDCKSSKTGLYIFVAILIFIISIVFVYLYREGYFSGLFQRKSPEEEEEKKRPANLPTGRAPGMNSDKDKIKKYIQETRKKGFTYSQIKKKLMNSGWGEDEINAAFSEI